MKSHASMIRLLYAALSSVTRTLDAELDKALAANNSTDNNKISSHLLDYANIFPLTPQN